MNRIPDLPAFRRRGLPYAAAALVVCVGFISVAKAQGWQARTGERQVSTQQQTCLRLEHDLANNWLGDRNQQKDSGRQLDAQIRKYQRTYQVTQAKANRSGCYRSGFIFGRQLVRSRRCIRLHNSIEDARRRLAGLQQQKDAASRRRSRSSQRDRQADLIDALARNGCGAQYQREARRRRGLFSWFTDDDWREPQRDLETSRIVPYATYRTLCVRSCDGFYFPINFSALPSRFQNDAQMCTSQCAAPAELYVYRNPGEQPEQMVSLDGKAYSQLPNAWRHRKEYVKGCSCKVSEYSPADMETYEKEKAEKAAAPKDKRGKAKITTTANVRTARSKPR